MSSLRTTRRGLLLRSAWVFLALLGCGHEPQPRSVPSQQAHSTADEPGTQEVTPPVLPLDQQAAALAHNVIVVDGHIDLPMRLHAGLGPDGMLTEDVSLATKGGDIDYPRAKAGGLDAPFMSIYISPKFEMKGADKVAEQLIDIVIGLSERHPNKFALAPSVAAVRKNFAAGKISLPMGMENGAPLMGKLSNVEHFYQRGIRYITLAHSKDNHISDSSYDTRHTHGGLTKFGKQVVVRMNRVGIMIDVSHISDDAFWQVMELSQAPVIASHSSCRHFTPGFERNMSDKMIKALADNGGVIQINFGSGFLDGKVRSAREAHAKQRDAWLAQQKLAPESEAAKTALLGYDKENVAPRATVATVADHIDHVVKLVGVEHVGLGSDFDGVGDSLPEGLRSAADYPNLFEELLRRGYTSDDIGKVASGNALRVWAQVEAYAAAHPLAAG